jgi:hypothetical protein
MDFFKTITTAALEVCWVTWGAVSSSPLLVQLLCGTLIVLRIFSFMLKVVTPAAVGFCWLLWRVVYFAPRLVQILCGAVFLPFAITADYLCDQCTYRVPCLRCLDRCRILLALALVCFVGLLAANTAHYSVGLCVCQHALRTGVDPGFVDIYSLSNAELAIIINEALRLSACAALQLASNMAGAAARLAR